MAMQVSVEGRRLRLTRCGVWRALATWRLLVLGFGLIGKGLRRRLRPTYRE